MTKNYLRLQVGEKVLGLKFNLGTYNFIQQLSGQDPFKFVAKSDGYEDARQFGKTIFHAALLSNCASQRKEPDFSAEDVETWFNELSSVDLVTIINMYSRPEDSSPVVNGEVVQNTQPAAVLG